MKNGFIIVSIMCGSRKEADVIVDALLKKRLAACGTVGGTVTSRFWWKGKLDGASEVTVTLKTTRDNFSRLEREVKRLHSYDVPEIVAFPVAAGSAAYLDWIRDTVA